MRLRQLVWSGLLAGLGNCGPADKPPTAAQQPGKAELRARQQRQAATRAEQARRQAMREQAEAERADSLWLDHVLQKALAAVGPHLGEAHFARRLEMADSVRGRVTMNLRIDRVFTGRQRHLLIRRQLFGNELAVNSVYFDFYKIAGRKLTPVLQHQQWTPEYLGDTLRDINGDGYQDFVVNWYGSNGCCLKAFSNVYLFQPATGGFSASFEFANPTFAPREKVVRGVNYGHPGATEMYKYRWRGAELDTVEYLYYEEAPDGHRTRQLMSARRLNGDGASRPRRLTRMPPEYRRIFGYDWFTGECCPGRGADRAGSAKK